MTAPLLQVDNLEKVYALKSGQKLTAVDGVSFCLAPGETLGLVGESGSGKSTIGKCVLRLEDPTAGRIAFSGIDLATAPASAIRPLRQRLTMVFQDPHDSLNPRMRVGEQVAEALLVNGICGRWEARDRVRDLFVTCGLKAELVDRYPHQLSGGQAQRVGIARALATEPNLVVLDEPTSSLDVSVQAKLINLLGRLKVERNLSYLFISHDLAVVNLLADRVAVMYLGRIVEVGRKEEIFSAPYHPYTMALISALTGDNPLVRRRERIVLEGDIPSPINLPRGCRLASRCPYAGHECAATPQELTEVAPGHRVACHRSVAGLVPRDSWLTVKA